MLSMPTPSNWNPGGDPRPKDCHFETKHRMEPETRAYPEQKRLQCHISGQWEIDSKMRKLQQNWTPQSQMLGKRGRVRRSISQVVERQTRCTHLQYHKYSHRHSNSLYLWIHWATGCLVCRFRGNHVCQSKSRGLYHIPCIHQRLRHQGIQKQHGKRVR